MKKLFILFIGLFLSVIAVAQPFTNIEDGESGLSVRTNLNNMVNYLNDLGYDMEFSTNGTSWHYGWASGDLYVRYSSDFGSTWSDAVYLWDGEVLGSIASDTLIIGTDTITGFTGEFVLYTDSLTTFVTPSQLSDSLTALNLDLDSNFVNINVSDTIFLAGDTIVDIQKWTGAGGDNSIISTKAYVDSTVVASGGYNDEAAQDAVGGILDDGTTGDIVFTYADATPEISATVEDDSHNHTIANVDNLQDSLDIMLTAEVDGSITNEGQLGVAAGAATNAKIYSNTSGSDTITISQGNNILVTETGNTITIAAGTVDTTSTEIVSANWQAYIANHAAQNVDASSTTAGNILVAASGTFSGVAMSGDVLIDSLGVTTVQPEYITDKGEKTTLGDNDRIPLYDATGADLDYILGSNLKTYVGGGDIEGVITGTTSGLSGGATSGTVTLLQNDSRLTAETPVAADYLGFYDNTNTAMRKAQLSDFPWLLEADATLQIITDNGSTTTNSITAVNFILSSDYRLKTNIQKLKNTWWINGVDFVSFQMKSDETGRLRYGVIAQDIENIAPEFVYTDSRGMKSVSYTDLLVVKVTNQDAIIRMLAIWLLILSFGFIALILKSFLK